MIHTPVEEGKVRLVLCAGCCWLALTPGVKHTTMGSILKVVREEAWHGLIPAEFSMDSSEVTSLQRPLSLYVSAPSHVSTTPSCLPLLCSCAMAALCVMRWPFSACHCRSSSIQYLEWRLRERCASLCLTTTVVVV